MVNSLKSLAQLSYPIYAQVFRSHWHDAVNSKSQTDGEKSAVRMFSLTHSRNLETFHAHLLIFCSESAPLTWELFMLGKSVNRIIYRLSIIQLHRCQVRLALASSLCRNRIDACETDLSGQSGQVDALNKRDAEFTSQ